MAATTPNDTSEVHDEQLLLVDGLQFHVRSAGDGPIVVLLHGFPDSGDIWRMQVPALVAAGHRVIVPDLRGFGTTDAPADVAAYRLDRLVQDVFDIVDALVPNAPPFDVVGHDWGAAVGWHACARYPERVRRFAALSVGHPEAYRRAGVEQKRKGWYLLVFMIPWLAETLLRARGFRALRAAAPTAEDAERWTRDLARPGRLTAALNWYRANLPPSALRQRLGSIRTPTLGLYGARDVALAEDQMTTSAQWVDAPWRYERFDDAGHWLQIDAADEVNRVLLRWLERS